MRTHKNIFKLKVMMAALLPITFLFLSGCVPKARKVSSLDDSVSATPTVSESATPTPTATPLVTALTVADIEGQFASDCIPSSGISYIFNWKIETGLAYAALKVYLSNDTCTGNYSLINFSKGEPITNYELTGAIDELNISGLPEGLHIEKITAIGDSSLSYAPIYITDRDHFQLMVSMDVNTVDFGSAFTDWTAGSADTLGFSLDPTGYVPANPGFNLALHRVHSLYSLDGVWEADCTEFTAGNYGILRQTFSGSNAVVDINFYGADSSCSGTPSSNYLVSNHYLLEDVSISGVPSNFRTVTSTDQDHSGANVKGAMYQINPDELYSYTTDPATLTGSAWSEWLASNATFASFAGAPTVPLAGAWHFTKIYDSVLDLSGGVPAAVAQFLTQANINVPQNDVAWGVAGNGKGYVLYANKKIIHLDENLDLDTKFGLGGILNMDKDAGGPNLSLGGSPWSQGNRIALTSGKKLIYPSYSVDNETQINIFTTKGIPAFVTEFGADGSHIYSMPHPAKTPGNVVPLDTNDQFAFWDFSYDGGTGDYLNRIIKGGLAAALDLNFDTDGIVSSTDNSYYTGYAFGVISSPSNLIFSKFGWISAATGAVDPLSSNFWNAADAAWGFNGKIAIGIKMQYDPHLVTTARVVKADSTGNLDATFGTAGESDILLESADLIFYNMYPQDFTTHYLPNGKVILIMNAYGLKKADCNGDRSVCGSPQRYVVTYELSSAGALLSTTVHNSDAVAGYPLFSGIFGNDLLMCYGTTPGGSISFVSCSKYSY